MTPAEVLQDAKQYLIENGWHQGAYFGSNGTTRPPACALGAIVAAGYDVPFPTWMTGLDIEATFADQPLIRLAAHYLTTTLRSEGYGAIAIPSWNDEPERTFANVLTAFEFAAQRAAEDERRVTAYEAQQAELELVPA